MFYTWDAWFTPWERRFPKSTRRTLLDSSMEMEPSWPSSSAIQPNGSDFAFPCGSKATQILKRRVDSIDDLQEIAELADTLAALNVRSRGRRQNTAAMIQGFVSRND